MPETGAGAAGEDIALDADHGADEGRPLGVGEGAGGMEDDDAALLLSVTPAIAAAGRGERGGAGAEVLSSALASLASRWRWYALDGAGGEATDRLAWGVPAKGRPPCCACQPASPR